VTGTVSFAAMTVAADRQFTLQFDGVLTMTHHATNLDLPGEANITTAAGDVATFQSTGSNTVQCINYTRADGTGVSGVSAQKNVIINGDFNIWKRGTSFAAIANGGYSADRWVYDKTGTMVHTITQETDVPTVAESGHLSKYSLKIDCTTVDSSIASGDICKIDQRIEGFNIAPLVQKAMKLSFWHKHTKTGIYCIAVRNSGGDRSFVSEYTQSVTDTWEKEEIDITASPSAGTWDYTTGIGIHLSFVLAMGSSLHGTADTWESEADLSTSNQVNACDSTDNNFMLSQVQLEAGGVATDFEVKNYADELARCQRYYEVLNGEGVAHSIINLGHATNAASSEMWSHWLVEKRVLPTITMSAAADFRLLGPTGNGLDNITGVTFSLITLRGCRTTVNLDADNLGTGDVVTLRDDGTGNARLYISAEL
jgi:hypothetical protein